MAETVLNYRKRKCYAEVLVFIGIIMGYFNHPLWELIFSILGNSGRSPGAHWRTSYLDKADIPCPRTCLGEDDAFTGDLYVQWNSKESVLEKDETELDAMNINDLERLWLFLCPEFECKGNSVCYVERVG